jgi:predicted transcriptional regulator
LLLLFTLTPYFFYFFYFSLSKLSLANQERKKAMKKNKVKSVEELIRKHDRKKKELSSEGDLSSLLLHNQKFEHIP